MINSYSYFFTFSTTSPLFGSPPLCSVLYYFCIASVLLRNFISRLFLFPRFLNILLLFTEIGQDGMAPPRPPHHRSREPAGGGSVTGTRWHIWPEIVTPRDSALPSVTHLSSGRPPLSGSCFQHVRFLTCCMTSSSRSPSSVSFYRLPRHDGPD